MASFQNSIEQMLWPEKRDKDAVLGDKVPGLIDRTTDAPAICAFRPAICRIACKPLLEPRRALSAVAFRRERHRDRPIPQGTPVNLLANLELLSESSDPAEAARARRARCSSCCSRSSTI